ncbi:hypothetical protein CCMSSC00406_0008964 [Pleurotus cornucopiae]|uniref:Uncharacterized protein n=1 Tax=Pleurotus cornucopiae TaxID=5321 RepID=A0ACB7J8U0_PLECO|nr:hypothetical protein CCMSSC00406_0008964 [Pleurotus cornucopiae]
MLACEGNSAEDKDIVDDTMECVEPLPHDDGEAPYELPQTASTVIRGQLATCATQICRDSFCWDRAGVTATRRVNYLKDGIPLMQFLRLFSRLDRPGKGFDPTTRLALETEVKEAKKYLERWAPHTDRRVFKMDVPSDNGRKSRQFLVWGALANPESPFGRATRGYPAVEIADGVISPKPVSEEVAGCRYGT